MRRQKYLSISAMIAYITFINMFIPLSTDLYLPALPEMGGYFSASEFLVGLTLTIFFFVFAVSMVLFGPLADKYGRRPILILGAAIYTVASFACAEASNIYLLLIGRFFQAVGSGAVITVATALIKDCFRGQVMRKILAITQALGVIAPMVAPLILAVDVYRLARRVLSADGVRRDKFNRGVFILRNFAGAQTLSRRHFKFADTSNRRWAEKIFHVVAYNVLNLGGTVHGVFKRVVVYLRRIFRSDRAGIQLLFRSEFGGVNLKLKDLISNVGILRLTFFISMLSGILVLSVGQTRAAIFLLSFVPFTVIESVARPFAMEILLLEAKENIGTASSMINFVPTLFGSLGMMLGTLPWGNFIDGLGLIITFATFLSIVLWILIRRGKFGSARQAASDLT